jgi:hypothetical protein
MKMGMFAFIVLITLAGCITTTPRGTTSERVNEPLSYGVETKQEEKIDGSITVSKRIKIAATGGNLPIVDLHFYSQTNGDDVKNFFLLGYAGDDWRFYNGITFNVDGKVFSLKIDPLRQAAHGGVAEVGQTEDISSEFADALKNAKSIKYQATADRFVDTINTLPEDAIEAMKQLL